MMKLCSALFFALIFFSCQPKENNRLDNDVLASLGKKYSNQYEREAEKFADQISADPMDIDALLGFAETKIILYIFGFVSRDESIPMAIEAFEKAQNINSQSAAVHYCIRYVALA